MCTFLEQHLHLRTTTAIVAHKLMLKVFIANLINMRLKMGTCKDQMKPKTENGKSLLGKLSGRWQKKSKGKEDTAQSFADHLLECHQTIGKLIATKEGELGSEKGQEIKNRTSLSILKAMEYNLEATLDLVDEYNTL
jgi:hypothetical protein